MGCWSTTSRDHSDNDGPQPNHSSIARSGYLHSRENLQSLRIHLALDVGSFAAKAALHFLPLNLIKEARPETTLVEIRGSLDRLSSNWSLEHSPIGSFPKKSSRMSNSSTGLKPQLYPCLCCHRYRSKSFRPPRTSSLPKTTIGQSVNSQSRFSPLSWTLPIGRPSPWLMTSPSNSKPSPGIPLVGLSDDHPELPGHQHSGGLHLHLPQDHRSHLKRTLNQGERYEERLFTRKLKYKPFSNC